MKPQPPTNDPRAAKIFEELQARKIKRHVDAVGKIMESETGRLVLADLLERFGLFKDCFNTNGTEQTKMVARQGCAQEIREIILRCAGPEKFYQMAQEADLRAQKDEADRDAKIKQLPPLPSPTHHGKTTA